MLMSGALDSSSSSLSIPTVFPSSHIAQQQQLLIPSKGYPRQILGQALNEIDTNFLCGYCEELLRNPVQAACGHRFCQICFNQLLEGTHFLADETINTAGQIYCCHIPVKKYSK